MQIPKFILMFCIATIGMSTLQAQRVDTEEQAKARELLRQKMAELDAQPPAVQPQQTAPPATKPSPPPKTTKTKKPVSTMAPLVAPAPNQQFPTRNFTGVPPLTLPTRVPPNAPEATPAPPSPRVAGGATQLTPETEAKAREEMRRKISESLPSASTPELATPLPAPKATAKPAVARKKEKQVKPYVVVTPTPTAPVYSPTPAVVPNSSNPSLPAPLTLQKPNPKVTSRKQKQVDQNIFDTPVPTTSFASPIPAAVPGSKSQKLAELLTLYRADAITPEDYHKQRAAILAQP